MATILPEKFDHGDFPAWLRQFECCASANKWDDEDKALKLPAFLRGVAATHFYALTDTQKDSYDHPIENLKAALCLRSYVSEKLARQLYCELVFLHLKSQSLTKLNRTEHIFYKIRDWDEHV